MMQRREGHRLFIGLVAISLSLLILGLMIVDLVGFRTSPHLYPLAPHFGEEYGWAYASALHYETSRWIAIVLALCIVTGAVLWVRGAKGWFAAVAAAGLVIWGASLALSG